MIVHDTVTVGREAGSGFIVPDPKVSRNHGTFRVMGGRLFYRDEKSTNGTYLNGNPVEEAEIKPGDVLTFGKIEVSLQDDDDFRTINFVSSETMVTAAVNTKSVQPDALAAKFSEIFEYYKENQPEEDPAEQYQLVRTQRMLNGLQTLYSISHSMASLLPLDELLERISQNLFELYAGAQNLVVLLVNDETQELEISIARTRDHDGEPQMSISQTVLEEALERRATLMANDAAEDSRFSGSESIIGAAVKSVMCAPLISGEKIVGALYLDNRIVTAGFDEMDAELVTAFANQCAVAIDNARLWDTLQEHYHQTLQSLVNAIEAKDSYTMGHTARVGKYSVGIAKHLGMDEFKLKKIKMAADLHDIGKIGVKEGIINKAGALSDTEYSSIKDHVEMGEKILSPIVFLADMLPWIRAHHEKWDGTGYPDGLKGEEIPLEGRILALADAFDAMTSKRTYNEPMTYDEALDRVKQSSGQHFDPQVVNAFESYLESEILGDSFGSTSHIIQTEE